LPCHSLPPKEQITHQGDLPKDRDLALLPFRFDGRTGCPESRSSYLCGVGLLATFLAFESVQIIVDDDKDALSNPSIHQPRKRNRVDTYSLGKLTLRNALFLAVLLYPCVYVHVQSNNLLVIKSKLFYSLFFELITFSKFANG
jgi:hypothetical protein